MSKPDSAQYHSRIPNLQDQSQGVFSTRANFSAFGSDQLTLDRASPNLLGSSSLSDSGAPSAGSKG